MFVLYYFLFCLVFSIGFYQYWMAFYPTKKTTGIAGKSRRVAEQWLCRAEYGFNKWTKWGRLLESSNFSVPDFHLLLSYSWFFYPSVKRSSGFLVYSYCVYFAIRNFYLFFFTVTGKVFLLRLSHIIFGSNIFQYLLFKCISMDQLFKESVLMSLIIGLNLGQLFGLAFF